MDVDNLCKPLASNQIHLGDARRLLRRIARESIALSIWSPPYCVGKDYEQDVSFEDWKALLRTVIRLHVPILKPGGFLVVNIADILCFQDETMPKIMAENISRRTVRLAGEDIRHVKRQHPDWDKYQLAQHFGCSEQTID